MTFAVEWAPAARRSMNSLPDKVVDAVLEFIYSDLVENPHRRGHALRDELDGLHTGRRGDFRVIYRVDTDADVVTIELVAARSANSQPAETHQREPASSCQYCDHAD